MEPRTIQKSSEAVVFFAFAVIVFLAAALLFVGAASRYLKTYASAQAAFAEVQKDHARAQTIQLQAQVADGTTDERAALMRLAVPKGGGADFIASIEQLGKNANVAASVASVAASAPRGDTPGTLTLVVSFSGSYGDCLRFVGLLETLHMSVQIPSLILQYNALAHTWSGTVSVSALSFETP